MKSNLGLVEDGIQIRLGLYLGVGLSKVGVQISLVGLRLSAIFGLGWDCSWSQLKISWNDIPKISWVLTFGLVSNEK